ncbi:MAG TPA: hypothetical protein VHS36_05860 [Candidatus Limnocylindrales bacterium]|nr:hypothetical protein [Candidatus Limnocylindrales bacterium]
MPGDVGDALISTEGTTLGVAEGGGAGLWLGDDGAGVLLVVARAVADGVADGVVAGDDGASLEGGGLAEVAAGEARLWTETLSVWALPPFPTTTTWSPSGDPMTDFAVPFRSTRRFSVGAVVGHGLAASGQTCSILVLEIS